MDNNEYTPLADSDEKFHIKETTGGTYKKIKMLIFKSSTSSFADKYQIATEFRLDTEDKKIFEPEYGIEEFYEKVCSEIFLEKGTFKFKNILMREVSRAIDDFFYPLKGNMPGTKEVPKS